MREQTQTTQNGVNVQPDPGVVQSSHQNLGSDEDWVIVNVEDHEVSAIPHASEVTLSKDSSLENEVLANFPDGRNRLHTIELKDEDLYLIVPKNLTFAEIINILDQAVKGDNCEELDKVVQKIGDYEGRSITLDSVNLRSFCEQQLNLDLNRSDHQHIHSNILSQYKRDQEKFKCDYSVKELLLLAISSNDKLVEQYRNELFAEENLSLLPLLVGGQKYIEAFIKKLYDVDTFYDKLKNQVVQLVEPNSICFFSAIALRKEQNLLEAVFVECVLKDLEQVLKTSGPYPLYGVLETASLVKNEEFITTVLDAFESYVNEPTRDVRDLLKDSFAALLETAISQDHVSCVEYLCKRYINSKGCSSYSIYEQAFADDKVITVLNKQVLKNIEVRGRRKIYDLVLKTAMDVGNIAFIERLCKKCTKSSNDVIDYLNQKLKGNELDNTYESTLVALSNIENENTIVTVLAHIQIYQNVQHNEQVIRQVIQNILKSVTHYSTEQEDYSLVKKVCYLCTEIDAVNVIFQEECRNFKSSIEKRIEDLEKENRLLQSEALHEYNYSYFPVVINRLAQIIHIAYDAYTEDQETNKYRENAYSALSLMHVRDVLQFSIDIQEYRCYERQDLWDAMYETPGTFVIRKRSNSAADKLAISVIKADILSEDPEPKSIGNQQLQKNTLDKGENIMHNEDASMKHPISNNHKEGKMHSSDRNRKDIEQELSDAIFSLDCARVESLVEQLKQGSNNIEQIIRIALTKADKTEVGRKGKASRNKLTEIKEFLAEELESITNAPALRVGRETSSQKTHINIDGEKKRVSSQPTGEITLQMGDELELNKDDQQLSQKDSASGNGHSSSSSGFVNVPASSGSGSSFENIESVPTSGKNSLQATTSDGSDKEAGQQVEPEVSNPQAEEDAAPLRTPEESENQKLASVVQNNGTENDVLSVQPTAPESTGEGQAEKKTPLQIEGKSEFEGKRDSPSPQSPASGVSTSSSFINISTSDRGATDSSDGEYLEVEDMAEDTAIKNIVSPQGIQAEASGPLSSASLSISNMSTAGESAVFAANIGDLQQLKTLAFNSEPSCTGAEGGTATPSLDGNEKKQTSPTGGTVQMGGSDDYSLSSLFSKGDNKNLRTVPLVLAQEPEPMLPLTGKKSEQANNTSPQNTKGSSLRIIAAPALATVGAALGVAIAVHLEMSAVGIIVGVCCLIPAAVICRYEWPSSFIETSKVEEFALDKKR